jgi:hypothetical protein
MSDGGGIESTRRFIEALNARDVEALREVLAEDAELRTSSGRALHGERGIEGLVKAAADLDVLIVRDGPERVEDNDGVTRVSVPVRELIGRAEVQGTALFELRDGRIAAFQVAADR